MSKRTIGFDDYEGNKYEEYTGEDPRPNTWYTGEVVRGRYDEQEDQLIFYVRLVDNPDYEGWTRGWYGPFEGERKWKLQDMVRALQGGVEKPVTLDWANETALANWLKKGKRIRFQTQMYNDSLTLRKVRPLLEATGAGKPSAAKAAAPKAAPAPEPVEDDEALEDYTEEELAGMEVSELEEIITEEFESELPEKATGRGAAVKYKKALVNSILEMQEEDQEETDEEDGSEDDPEFADGFDEEDGEADEEPEPEPEPDPAPRTRRRGAKPAPEPEPAPPARTRRARR